MAIIGIENLSSELDKELQVYSKEITEELKKVTKKHSLLLVKRTKETAPIGKRRSKKYRDSIKCKKESETPNRITYVWYVDSKDSNYRLTHLIVNGHALRNGGRSKSNPFLANAVKELERDYLKDIEEVIKNG